MLTTVFFSHEKKEILPFATTGMDRIMLSEVSQTEKDGCGLITLIGKIRKGQTHRNRVEWWLPRAGGEELGRCWPKGTNVKLEDE